MLPLHSSNVEHKIIILLYFYLHLNKTVKYDSTHLTSVLTYLLTYLLTYET